MGLDEIGILLVISHTFKNAAAKVVGIRIISARTAAKPETKQYEKGI